MVKKSKPLVPRPRKPKPPLYVGPWLRRLGLSQVEVAKAADIGESHMSLIISGDRYPGPGALAAIAEAMGLPEAALKRLPPDEATVSAIAGIDPAILARLSSRTTH
jgi:transcriptional regulator with XRE-family HTH domain